MFGNGINAPLGIPLNLNELATPFGVVFIVFRLNYRRRCCRATDELAMIDVRKATNEKNFLRINKEMLERSSDLKSGRGGECEKFAASLN